MDLKDRFRYIMKLNQLTASAFADEIGVQRSSVSHILSGRNKPSLEFIKKVLDRYPKVDASWLINGTTNAEKSNMRVPEGEMESPALDKSTESTLVQNSSDQSGKKKIKRILIFYDDQSFEEFHPA